MATTQINISTDSNLISQAQSILAELGLDMTTAFNLFLRQIVYKEPVPFVKNATEQVTKMRTGVLDPARISDEEKEQMLKNRMATIGIMKGEIWMADDFDALLEDMKEYME